MVFLSLLWFLLFLRKTSSDFGVQRVPALLFRHSNQNGTREAQKRILVTMGPSGSAAPPRERPAKKEILASGVVVYP